jgi:hypothetical protein
LKKLTFLGLANNDIGKGEQVKIRAWFASTTQIAF